MFVVVALACGWLVVEMKEAKKQREAAAAIEKSHGLVGQSWGAPAWLRTLLGDYFFASIRVVSFVDRYHQVTDAQLHELRDTLAGLNQLQELAFYNAQITDAGLVHFEKLTTLHRLNLTGAKVTDAGLVHLGGLTQLEILALNGTKVTDAGLAGIAGLTQLAWLSLKGTKVTNVGVAKLRKELPNCQIVGP